MRDRYFLCYLCLVAKETREIEMFAFPKKVLPVWFLEIFERNTR